LFVHTQREEIPPKWKNSAVMTQRWRCLNGSELYNMQTDPGQTTDVAARHPDVLQELRAKYEAWWSSVEPVFARFAYIVIGSPQEDPVRLTCMDWHAPTVREIPWNQQQIDKMPQANGWWMVDVAQAGRYAFTLRHKPAETAFPLQAGRARVRLGDRQAETVVTPGAAAATVTLELPQGPARLDTWLLDEAAGDSRGAFFVEIRRLLAP
jgi:hypothetical protein